jgi:ribose transport system permease protein
MTAPAPSPAISVSSPSRPLAALLFENASVILFVAVFLLFSALSPRFFAVDNLVNILIHASSLGTAACGMTFVLLVAGIDLSVGSIMFLATIVAGKLVLAGAPVPVAFVAVLATGLVFGAVNALVIVRFGVMAFVVTLATLYAGRGVGLLVTETRAMNLPEAFQSLGAARPLGVPVPVLLFGAVALVAHLVLGRTPYGRRLYAVGSDADAARRAGLPVKRLLVSVYLVCAGCAALAGFVSVSLVGAVSPSFGQQRELSAIAAAVLGGTSLFGGRGQIFPGTVVGALLIQTVETGLVILNVDPYLYPLITAAVIFLAVVVDGARNRQLLRLRARRIRPLASA